MSNTELSGSHNVKQTTSLNDPVGEFSVQFWGVRGLIATPSSDPSRYGGNTGCVEMRVAGKRLIFDGGTGLRILGRSWLELQSPLTAHLFFTNSQSNRIQGFPFFAPAFVSENCFHLYGTAASNGASIKQSLCDQMLQPHFPYPLQVMQANLQFNNLASGSKVILDDLTIQTALINQNQRSAGYRVSWNNYSVAYMTDLYQDADEIDLGCIRELVEGVDLLIANATYNPPTAHNHESSDLLWKTAVNLADHAGVKQLVISHHHPDAHDDFLDSVQTEVKNAFPEVLLAREGLILSVVGGN
ncbi:MAG: MBL fold metallo-hydrolase [Tolypothrix brevis GSE-NOS-MK-07-07A]|jgi:phosphoribosyl 1,2-cyclic phosphodiesterase|nr:MBL fold metallo-hydrolase [Tolypothrix brevis GSE-NOS-MK-07-07A]